MRGTQCSAGMMDYATGHYDLPYGRIESSWQRNDADGSVTYQFTIPANTQAQVIPLHEALHPRFRPLPLFGQRRRQMRPEASPS